MFKVGDIIQVHRFPFEADLDKIGSPTEVAHLGAFLPSIGPIAWGPDYEREQWVGVITWVSTTLSGRTCAGICDPPPFLKEYVVKWLQPRKMTRTYANLGPRGFVMLYDRENE